MPLNLHECRRLLIFGGSFDPPHVGHVTLPPLAARAVDADGIVYVPSGRPPHKPQHQLAPVEHRRAMLELALADRNDASVCTFELEHDGPSYTLTTLEYLRSEVGDHVELRLLMGADMAATFYTWHRPAAILDLAEPVVMMRPPHDVEAFVAQLPDVLGEPARRAWAKHVVPVPQMDVSSTAVRDELARPEPDLSHLADMLPAPVLQYIREHRLYRAR